MCGDNRRLSAVIPLSSIRFTLALYCSAALELGTNSTKDLTVAEMGLERQRRAAMKSEEMWREGSRGRARATGRKKRMREKTEGGMDKSVGVFIGVIRGEINKRGEKSLCVLRAPSPRQLKGPSKGPSNQRLNKDRSRRRFGQPRSCNLTPTALHSVAP